MTFPDRKTHDIAAGPGTCERFPNELLLFKTEKKRRLNLEDVRKRRKYT